MSIHQPRTDLYTVIRRLGQGSNLQFCLDAGHELSLPAASSKWLDLSPNGYDFFRGQTASGEGSDPSINGIAGGRSSAEYLSWAANQGCKYDTTIETWMNNLHKAAAKFSFCGWYSFGAVNGLQALFGTLASQGGSSPAGIMVQINGIGQFGFVAQRSGGTASFLIDSSLVASPGVWSFCAGTVNEAGGANASFLQLSGGLQTFNAAFSSPSSTAAPSMSIGATGGNVSAGVYWPLLSGAKVACLAMWESRVLGPAELEAIYQSTRSRFGV